MRGGLLLALAGTFVVMLLGSSAIAQNQPPPAPAAAPLTPAQLDQLTAPIALYPDALVGQILMAATYPLEVVEAARWVQQPANASLKGDQLAAALVPQPWDPSVKSLVAFPQILKMMNGNLTWTEQLGDAFLAAQSAVMDLVQRLRQQAETAGKLKSTSQMAVSTVGGFIVIAPPNPNSLYVPVYNPNDIYGAWAYPDYPPDYFPGYFPGVEIGPLGFGWWDVGIIAPLWGWDRGLGRPPYRYRRRPVQRPQSQPSGNRLGCLAARPVASRRRALSGPGRARPVPGCGHRQPSCPRLSGRRARSGGRTRRRRREGAGTAA